MVVRLHEQFLAGLKVLLPPLYSPNTRESFFWISRPVHIPAVGYTAFYLTVPLFTFHCPVSQVHAQISLHLQTKLTFIWLHPWLSFPHTIIYIARSHIFIFLSLKIITITGCFNLDLHCHTNFVHPQWFKRFFKKNKIKRFHYFIWIEIKPLLFAKHLCSGRNYSNSSGISKS